MVTDEGDRRRTRYADRRSELLAATADHVEACGLADLSLRSLARAIGISHVALLRHFESKERLLISLLNEMRARDRLRVASIADALRAEPPERRLEAAWRVLSADEHLPYWRFFFEAYAMAIRDPERYQEFLTALVEEWLELIDALLGDDGDQALATALLAAVRGLIIDLLSTGDRDRVDAAVSSLAPLVRSRAQAGGRGREGNEADRRR